MAKKLTPSERLAGLLARAFIKDLSTKLPKGHPLLSAAYDGRPWETHFLEQIGTLLPIDREELWKSACTIARSDLAEPDADGFCGALGKLWRTMDSDQQSRCFIAFLAVANAAKARMAALPRTTH